MPQPNVSDGVPQRTTVASNTDVPDLVWWEDSLPATCDRAELDRALARLPGAAVVPLVPIENRDGQARCGCHADCERTGKHAAVFWKAWPAAKQILGQHGHAILTGTRSGYFVVETDRKDGVDGESNLLALGALPVTFSELTPSGSRHRVFRMPADRVIRNTQSELADGVDVRGDGGLAVLAGSPHRFGGVYRIENDVEPVDAPDWLLARLCDSGTRDSNGATSNCCSALLTADEANELVEAIVASAPPKGKRNDWRMCVRGILLSSGHEVEEAEDIVEAVARELCADAREFVAVVRSQHGHGYGWPKFTELVGDGAKERVSRAINPRQRERNEVLKEALRRTSAIDTKGFDSTSIADLSEKAAELPIVIMITDEMYKAMDAGCAALARSANIYQREGRLIQPLKIAGPVPWARDTTASGVPMLREIPTATLACELTRVAAWEKYDGRAKTCLRTQPPDRLVSAISQARAWPGVRPLYGVVETPLFRADGSILQTAGYDAATGVIYDPCGVDFPLVPDAPTLDDARAAFDSLLEPFEEFPFATEADALVPSAIVLTVLALGALSGANFPCFPFDANVQGTGKTLCADACSWILTGREVPKQNFPSHDQNELEKILGGVALDAAPMLCLDNVNGTFGGDALELRMTCRGTSQFRILGKTGNPTLPWRTVVLASGNNIRPTVDMRRRIVRCRLVSTVEDPETRPIKRTDLRGWIRDRRPALVVAGLTILRAYVVAGKPAQTVKPMGNFEEWTGLVASALKWVSGVDVLDARMPNAARFDPATEAYAAFLAAAKLDKLYLSKDVALMSCWDELIPVGERDRTKRVGMLLAKMEQRPIGGRQVERAENASSQVARFRVVTV